MVNDSIPHPLPIEPMCIHITKEKQVFKRCFREFFSSSFSVVAIEQQRKRIAGDSTSCGSSAGANAETRGFVLGRAEEVGQGGGLTVEDGDRAGAHKIKEFVKLCSKYGVKVVTVFGFSTENWVRPKVSSSFSTFLCSFFSLIRK